MKKTSHLVILLLILSTGIFLTSKSTSALTTPSGLKGKILLQVESRGEAWYVSPADGKRYNMGRPNDAFNLMRKLGIGISNDNLNKIQIADENLTGLDSDGDGLSNMVEDSIGTDKNNKDSDGDGFDDRSEILNGYNPKGTGKMLIDNNFSKQQSGKILLQVEGKGEAWYVNPNDNKRYFLGRPNDAFNLMRKLGLGITNNDLNKIVENIDKNKTEIVQQKDEIAKTSDTYVNDEYKFTINNLVGWKKINDTEGIIPVDKLKPPIVRFQENIKGALMVLNVLDDNINDVTKHYNIEKSRGENIIPIHKFTIDGANAIQAGYRYSDDRMTGGEINTIIELSTKRLLLIQIMTLKPESFKAVDIENYKKIINGIILNK